MMTPDEFRRTLAALGWTQERTAQELDVSLRTVSRYVTGGAVVPRAIELALQGTLARQRSRSRTGERG
jgi:transcriptional regulator with XRE-family HTH domain